MGAPVSGSGVSFRTSSLGCAPNVCNYTRQGEYHRRSQTLSVPYMNLGNVNFETLRFTTERTARVLSKTGNISVSGSNAILNVSLQLRNKFGFNANLQVHQPAIPGSTGNTYTGTHGLNAGQVRTINYSVNLGSISGLPNTITVPVTRVTDPSNRTVVLSDQVPSGVESTLFDRSMWVRRSAINNGQGNQPNFSYVNSNIRVTLKGYSTYSDVITLANPPSSSLNKTVTNMSSKNNTSEPGEEFTYYIRVTNNGGTATGAVLRDDYDESKVEYVSVSPAPSSHNASTGQITWNLGNLPGGYDQTFQLRSEREWLHQVHTQLLMMRQLVSQILLL
jgi:hypothetical protein